MWKKTLVAAAMSGFALSVPAAEQEPEPPQDPKPPQDGEPARLAPVKTTGERPDQGFKAQRQSGATKMPLSLRETPQSVSVITRESMDERQVFNLQQAFELSAGVTQHTGNGPFAGQPSFGFNGTTIRGIAIDDLYDFRDDGFVSGSYFALPDLAIYDSIEVIKGPNSVLYGRGSVGGLINRVRKKPLAKAQADVELSVGSFDTYRADVDVSGPLLSRKDLRGRVVAVYEDSGSFVEGAETQRTVLAPSLDFDLSPGTSLLLQAMYQSDDIMPNTGMPLRESGDGLDAPNISRRQRNGVTNRAPYTWKIGSLTAQLDHQLNDDWLATLRLASSNIDTPIRVDGYAYGFRDEGDDPDTVGIIERVGDTTIIGSQHWIDRDIWSGELRISGRFEVEGHEVKATLGADINDNQYSRRGIYNNVEGFYGYGPVANIYDGGFTLPDQADIDPGANFGGDPRSVGYYAQAQISATDRLKLLLGGRYDHVKLRESTAGVNEDSETVSDVTGRIGLTYELRPEVSVYSLYAQSFQPVLFSRGADRELLDPETGEIFEFGARSEWFDRRLGVSTAIYRVNRDKIPVALDGPGNISVSSGRQRSDGYEVEINGQPLPGWDLSLAYNRLVESAFRDRSDVLLFGTKPGGAPDWQLGLYSAYELQTGPLRGLGLGATFFAIDERGVSPFEQRQIPGYERIDLHAFYRGLKNVEFNLLVRNVTDERYVEGADRKNNYAQFGSPTAALLSIKYSLGK